jgi:hypothetical protein
MLRLVPLFLLPMLVFVLGFAFLPVLLVPLVMLVSALLTRGGGSAPGDSDQDGGGGTSPPEPRTPFHPPRGDLPLPDADPSDTRLRDHDRPASLRPPRRRTVRDGARTTPPSRRR